MEENVFEQMANKYDTAERIEMAKVITEKVKDALQNSETNSLIDYGSGTGLVGLELTPLVKSVLLIDSSQKMLDVAQAKITQKGISNASTLYSDFTQEIPDHVKADIVVMSLVLLHIPDTRKILQSLFNILNDEGKLIIVDFDKNDKIQHPKVHNGFVQNDLKNLLSVAGFKSTDIHTFHHGKSIFMNQDASMFLASSLK
ncbi:class I SAM-dependent methyltransferase [Cytobacillus gottheilii]|uniref:Methyltransferase domain-containing protein n=1 Tax=Cytobacillus gottheilii TaxID=859144 RepID=A0ABX8F7X4_9BACI|nr:methyltransferase domain-containing protein [Cytobacillus gottheilii]QVY60436.1 methyltransferase domain-containing protein [Cytobacillus gottheilii]